MNHFKINFIYIYIYITLFILFLSRASETLPCSTLLILSLPLSPLRHSPRSKHENIYKEVSNLQLLSNSKFSNSENRCNLRPMASLNHFDHHGLLYILYVLSSSCSFWQLGQLQKFLMVQWIKLVAPALIYKALRIILHLHLHLQIYKLLIS